MGELKKFGLPDPFEELRNLRKENRILRKGLEEIESGAWKLFPNTEQPIQIANRVLRNADCVKIPRD